MGYGSTEYGIWNNGVWDMEVQSLGYGSTESGIWKYRVWNMEVQNLGNRRVAVVDCVTQKAYFIKNRSCDSS